MERPDGRATECVIAIDAGTTGVRSRAVFADTRRSPIAAYREFPQHYPEPGWVEHDPLEIWDAVVATLHEVVDRVGEANVVALGITNQRETVVAWDRVTGDPYGMAIVWQDRRTADRCGELERDGHLAAIRSTTGLVLDPYFSATKIEWLLRVRGIPTDGLAVGTVDSWLVWRLTGGAAHVSDPTNAARTMLFDIGAGRWSQELCDLFGVPMAALPDVRPTSGRLGVTSARWGAPAGISISAIVGDQQAALFGQACFAPGMAKNTYGTGSFVLMNVGGERPAPTPGLLTTIAWDLGAGPVYALEGSVFVTGAAVQWLRDGLGIIDTAAEVGPLAASVDSGDGVIFVPAFTGLGSPWWDPRARGTIVGITRGTTRAHLARAVVEAMALQTRDVVDAMARAGGRALTDLRVDGGAAAMDLLLQIQADQVGVSVRRPADPESTALGAAFLAGLAEGVWPDLEAVARQWRLDRAFEPGGDRQAADALHARWLRAVERSKGWVDATPT